jgi:hypothetical protein
MKQAALLQCDQSSSDWPSAALSDDGQYRYFLSRCWNSSGRKIAFIGLNPSTADATNDDPTIRRCIRFARDWGGGSVWMVNLFAFRSTQPAALRSATDPIGPENDAWLERAIDAADIVIAAWGNHGHLLGRSDCVANRYRGRLHALAVTKNGMPGHPLYVRADTHPRPFGV